MNRALCLLIFLVILLPWPSLGSSVARDIETPDLQTVKKTVNRQVHNTASPWIAAAGHPTIDSQRVVENLIGPLDSQGLDSGNIAETTTMVQASGLTELLGPLTPLALSPFFGVTCLSAISLWGPEWASNSPMLGSSGALRSETIFITFLVLTLISSIPRFTKVSKPFAQAVDRLEAYAVIIILIVVKIAANVDAPGNEPVVMLKMGVPEIGLETFLALAMIVNILVINSVKFFFEFLAWLTPVPFMDAVFEVCNKTLCIGLMAIYAFSPTLATVINLAFFLVALIVFRWIYRRTLFYRTMILDPVLARVWPPYAKARNNELVVFNRSELGKFPAKSRLRLRRREDGSNGWILRESRWWLPQREFVLETGNNLAMHLGWLMHSVQISDGDHKTHLTFSRRYNEATLRTLATELGITMTTDVIEHSSTERALEFG